jgi:hypothetical protein
MNHMTPPPSDKALPCADALLAGTLALMTGYSCAPNGCPMRPLMAAKLARNLAVLSRHPEISSPMKVVLGKLLIRWRQGAESTDSRESPQQGAALWHRPPGLVQ